eukprot:161-Chlamydomonas_euryale.AAC.1
MTGLDTTLSLRCCLWGGNAQHAPPLLTAQGHLWTSTMPSNGPHFHTDLARPRDRSNASVHGHCPA